MEKKNPNIGQKALITGCGGMLGDSMYRELLKQGFEVLATDINLTSNWLKKLDVRSCKDIEKVVKKFKPDIIFHLAAETDLEICENNPDHAYQTNVLGTQNVALSCFKHNLPIVYIGTIGSFDGTKETPYTEFDEPNPLNVYGKTKLEGEKAIRQLIQRHFIVRACWMVGGGEKDKKFIGKIAKQIRKGAKELIAVTDKIGTPTYAKQFSHVIGELVKTEYYGTYHCACKGICSRYDVAKEIVKFTGKNIKVTPIKSDDPRIFKDYPTHRPYSEAMENLGLRLRGLDTMTNWKKALREYLEEHFSDLKK